MCKPLIGYKSVFHEHIFIKGSEASSRQTWHPHPCWAGVFGMNTSCSMGTLGNVLLGTGRRCGEELTRGPRSPLATCAPSREASWHSCVWVPNGTLRDSLWAGDETCSRESLLLCPLLGHGSAAVRKCTEMVCLTSEEEDTLPSWWQKSMQDL